MIDLIDKAGVAGKVLIFSTTAPPAGAAVVDTPLVEIILGYPCGVIDPYGVALATTEWAQITADGNPKWARIIDGNGLWVADLSAGLGSEVPTPELPLPNANLYIGAFIRLKGAHIVC